MLETAVKTAFCTFNEGPQVLISMMVELDITDGAKCREGLARTDGTKIAAIDRFDEKVAENRKIMGRRRHPSYVEGTCIQALPPRYVHPVGTIIQ